MIIVTRIGAGLLMGCGSQDNLGRGGERVQTVLPRSQEESEQRGATTVYKLTTVHCSADKTQRTLVILNLIMIFPDEFIGFIRVIT